jgi:hypothetical protein
VSEPSRPEPVATRATRAGAMVILALLALTLGSGIATLVWSAFQAPTGAPGARIRGGPDVVVAVRDLARLESAQFHMERVIELTRTEQRLFGLVDAEDSILLVAAADVTAGVDLAELREGDVRVDPDARTARITLPAPRVLSTRLDSERTFVHSRTTDLLARRGEDLESEARRQAERTLEEGALEAGILERARTHAATTVEALVRSLGYDEVVVGFRD